MVDVRLRRHPVALCRRRLLRHAPKPPSTKDKPATSYGKVYSSDPFGFDSTGFSGSSSSTDCVDRCKVEIVSTGGMLTSDGPQLIVTYRPDGQAYKLAVIPNDKYDPRGIREAICAAEKREADQRQKTDDANNLLH